LLDRLSRLLKEEKEIPRLGSGSKKFHKQHIFASKSVVQSYINTYFPSADHEFFLSSLSWRIPALLAYDNPVLIAIVPIRQITHEACDSNYGDFVVSKVNNEGCPNLLLEKVDNYSQTMSCDVCCSEPLFCLACCCILCGKTVSTYYGGVVMSSAKRMLEREC